MTKPQLSVVPMNDDLNERLPQACPNRVDIWNMPDGPEKEQAWEKYREEQRKAQRLVGRTGDKAYWDYIVQRRAATESGEDMVRKIRLKLAKAAGCKAEEYPQDRLVRIVNFAMDSWDWTTMIANLYAEERQERESKQQEKEKKPRKASHLSLVG